MLLLSADSVCRSTGRRRDCASRPMPRRQGGPSSAARRL